MVFAAQRQRVAALRKIVNVAIDAMLGAVPLAGDLFDVAWKANLRNLALLEGHAAGDRPAAAGDWLFVSLLTLLVAAISVVPFVMAGWLLAALGRRLF